MKKNEAGVSELLEIKAHYKAIGIGILLVSVWDRQTDLWNKVESQEPNPLVPPIWQRWHCWTACFIKEENHAVCTWRMRAELLHHTKKNFYWNKDLNIKEK